MIHPRSILAVIQGGNAAQFFRMNDGQTLIGEVVGYIDEPCVLVKSEGRQVALVLSGIQEMHDVDKMPPEIQRGMRGV